MSPACRYRLRPFPYGAPFSSSCDQLDVTHALHFQKIGEGTERERMPFNCFEAVDLASMIENILFNGRLERPFHSSRRALAVVRRRQQRGCRLTLLVGGRSKNTGTLPIQGRHSQRRSRYSHDAYQLFNPGRGRHSLKHISVSSPQKSSPLATCEGAPELASCVREAGDGARTSDSLHSKQVVTLSPLAWFTSALQPVSNDTHAM
jgi:hypothetical protein